MNLSKIDKGVVFRYLVKLTDHSRQQLTRLIWRHAKTGETNWNPYRINGFSIKYTRQGIALLDKTDELHDTPRDRAVKKFVSALWMHLMMTTINGDQNHPFPTCIIFEILSVYNLLRKWFIWQSSKPLKVGHSH